MSTRITTTQRSRIVTLFSTGTSMHCLADVWGVDVTVIEAIIRAALERSCRC